MRTKTLALLVLTLAIPAVALAATAQHGNAPDKRAAAGKVMYVLKGSLWNFAAASSGTEGSITIHVTRSNYHGRALKGTALTLAVSSRTTTTLDGAPTISDGSRGIVKFAALRNLSTRALLAALRPDHMTARQIIEHGTFRLIPPTD